MVTTAVAPATVGVEVGDFFVSTWGYDQTNVDFYKVVGLTPKGVKIQKWSSAAAEGGGANISYVVPGEGPVTTMDYSAAPEGADYWDRQAAAVEVEAPVVTKRLQSYDGGKSVYFALTSYSSASKWSGQKVYETTSGWGH